MAEEVDIGNVGGNGVASEVTLARLTATMELMAKAKGVNPADITKKMNQVMDESSKIIGKNTESTKKQTKEVDKSTKILSRFGKGILGMASSFVGTIGSSLSGFAGALTSGSDQLSDFAVHVPIFGGVLGSLAGLIDENVDSFRSLSNVGAQFGDGLNDVRQLANAASIPLGEFTDLVSNNAEKMRFFGGTVGQGAATFAKMSKELRDGPGRQFINMGYTATDLNEALIEYAEFNATMMNSERRMQGMSTKGAVEYLEVVDSLSRVTGKRRDQIREEMQAAGSDARARMAMSQMGLKQQAQFAAGLEMVGSKAPAIKEALIDLADGVANSEVTGVLEGMSDTFKNQARDFESMDAGQQNNFLAKVKDEIDAKANELDQIAVQGLIKAGGSMGELFQSAANLREFNIKSDKQLLADNKAARAQANKDAGILGFSQTLRDIKAQFMSIITGSDVDFDPESGEKRPKSLLEKLTSGISKAGEALMKFVKSPAFESGIKMVEKAMMSLVKNFETFMAEIDTFGVGGALFGGKKEVETPEGAKTVETKGLFGNLFATLSDEDGPIMKMFTSMMDIVGEKVVPIVIDILKGAVKAMFKGVVSFFANNWDTILIGALAGIGTLIAGGLLAATFPVWAPIVAAVGGIVAIGVAIVAMFSWEAIKDVFNSAWDSITGIFSGISTWWDSVDLMTPINEMWAKVTGFFTFEEGFSISALFGKAWDLVTGYFSFAGEVWMGIGGLFDAAWTKVTGWMGFGDKTWSLSELMSDAWNSVTGFFSMDTLYSIGNLADAAWETVTGWFGIETTFSITSLFTDAWTKVTEFLSFGEEGFSISALFGKAWELVTGWFSFATDTAFSIAQLGADAWKTVTGWFGFGDGTGFSISQLATDAWKTVTGWFGFGDGTGFSISQLATDAWKTVTGFFGFGDSTGFSISQLATDAWKTVTGFFGFGDSTGFSISQLATDAWATVTGFFSFGGGKEGTGFSISQLATDAWGTVKSFFSFDNFEFPSISSLFDNIWDKLTGFFDFDFKLPSFKSFLPKWLGGEGESLADADVDSKDTQVAPDSKDMALATTGISELEKTQAAMQSFASLPELTQNLDSLKKGLDIDNVRTYTTAMEDLVKVLAKLNDELGKDNKAGFGTGTNAGSVVSKMDTIGSGGGNNSEQLNNTMLAILSELQLQTVGLETTAKNTKNIRRK